MWQIYNIKSIEKPCFFIKNKKYIAAQPRVLLFIINIAYLIKK